MRSSPIVLAIDAGSTSAKAQCFDPAGRALGPAVRSPVAVGPDGTADPAAFVASVEAAVDEGLARSIARAVKAVDRELLFVVMPMTALESAGDKEGLKLAREVFADRAYDDTGNLVSRKLPGAMIHDAETAAARAVRMVEGGAIECASGKRIKVDIDTICVHGDSPTAVAMAQAVRAKLEGAGVPLRPMREIVG